MLNILILTTGYLIGKAVALYFDNKALKEAVLCQK